MGVYCEALVGLGNRVFGLPTFLHHPRGAAWYSFLLALIVSLMEDSWYHTLFAPVSQFLLSLLLLIFMVCFTCWLLRRAEFDSETLPSELLSGFRH
ncbi:hypothetical protein L873DRAFT_277669 [Choiromyces venosus 120613-1]|uniref:Uncharacterized protein n=1 Tax=Choiromyces venosus 120613-1 TaxID=1336337 RepID=A0A3N4JXJ9_9PEZI|nr:hypothetical protein L873DRAFT_277669 [Choiromyces venosus 120613-1]